jgi:hypothetical protein
MKEKGNYRFNIGGASIILLLVVLALTLFAVLSIRASYHELQLTKKTTEVVEEYYLADAKAEDILMQVNEKLELYHGNNIPIDLGELYSEIKKIEGVTEAGEQDNIVNYQVEMNDVAFLKVKLNLNIMPETDPVFEVKSWKMVNIEQGDYGSNDIDIWDGNIEE